MVDAKVIRHVAHLAKLEIADAELEKYCDQLIKVLAQFEEIKQINTEGIEPLITPIEIEQYLREDVAQQNHNPEEMLANAPERTGNLFAVPPVV